jgi:GNAT superfamily N-acetyltransferase
MRILRAKPDDAARLTKIAFMSKRHWGYPERWIASWTHLLTVEPRSIAEQETYTAYVEGVPVGFYSLGRGPGRISLEHLWVLPEAMRRGVGRALFAHAVERVRALGCETLEIESDPNAAGFYEHMGAHRVATTVTELEGRPRELPVLVYEITHAA